MGLLLLLPVQLRTSFYSSPSPSPQLTLDLSSPTFALRLSFLSYASFPQWPNSSLPLRIISSAPSPPPSSSATTQLPPPMQSTQTHPLSPPPRPELPMKLLFVEMGVGYDQHGQDITMAAVRACKNAISSNSIPAFRTGAIPGITWQEMKLKLKLGVPRATQDALDLDKVKAVFPYGEIMDVEVVDGGLICSSGVALEAMGDKSDDCYIVNAAVYVGY